MKKSKHARIRALLGDSMLGLRFNRGSDLPRSDIIKLAAKDPKIDAALETCLQSLSGIAPKEENLYDNDPMMGDLSYAIRNFKTMDEVKKGAISNLINSIMDSKVISNSPSYSRISKQMQQKVGLIPKRVSFKEPLMGRGGETTIGQGSSYVPSDTWYRREVQKQGNAAPTSNLSAEQAKGQLLPKSVHPDALSTNQSLPIVTSIQDAMTDISTFCPTGTEKNNVSVQPVSAEMQRHGPLTNDHCDPKEAPIIGQKRKLSDFQIPLSRKMEMASNRLSKTFGRYITDAPNTNSLNRSAYQNMGQGTGQRTTMGGQPGMNVLPSQMAPVQNPNGTSMVLGISTDMDSSEGTEDYEMKTESKIDWDTLKDSKGTPLRKVWHDTHPDLHADGTPREGTIEDPKPSGPDEKKHDRTWGDLAGDVIDRVSSWRSAGESIMGAVGSVASRVGGGRRLLATTAVDPISAMKFDSPVKNSITSLKEYWGNSKAKASDIIDVISAPKEYSKGSFNDKLDLIKEWATAPTKVKGVKMVADWDNYYKHVEHPKSFMNAVGIEGLKFGPVERTYLKEKFPDFDPDAYLKELYVTIGSTPPLRNSDGVAIPAAVDLPIIRNGKAIRNAGGPQSGSISEPRFKSPVSASFQRKPGGPQSGVLSGGASAASFQRNAGGPQTGVIDDIVAPAAPSLDQIDDLLIAEAHGVNSLAKEPGRSAVGSVLGNAGSILSTAFSALMFYNVFTSLPTIDEMIGTFGYGFEEGFKTNRDSWLAISNDPPRKTIDINRLLNNPMPVDLEELRTRMVITVPNKELRDTILGVYESLWGLSTQLRNTLTELQNTNKLSNPLTYKKLEEQATALKSEYYPELFKLITTLPEFYRLNGRVWDTFFDWRTTRDDKLIAEMLAAAVKHSPFPLAAAEVAKGLIDSALDRNWGVPFGMAKEEDFNFIKSLLPLLSPLFAADTEGNEGSLRKWLNKVIDWIPEKERGAYQNSLLGEFDKLRSEGGYRKMTQDLTHQLRSIEDVWTQVKRGAPNTRHLYVNELDLDTKQTLNEYLFGAGLSRETKSERSEILKRWFKEKNIGIKNLFRKTKDYAFGDLGEDWFYEVIDSILDEPSTKEKAEARTEEEPTIKAKTGSEKEVPINTGPDEYTYARAQWEDNEDYYKTEADKRAKTKVKGSEGWVDDGPYNGTDAPVEPPTGAPVTSPPSETATPTPSSSSTPSSTPGGGGTRTPAPTGTPASGAAVKDALEVVQPPGYKQPQEGTIPQPRGSFPLFRAYLQEGGADVVSDLLHDASLEATNRLVWQSFNNGQWEANEEWDNPLHQIAITEDIYRFTGELDKDDVLADQSMDAIQEEYNQQTHVAYEIPNQVMKDGQVIIQDILSEPLAPTSSDSTNLIFHDVYMPPWIEVPADSPWNLFTAIEGTQIPDTEISNPDRITGNDWPLLASENAFIKATLD